MSAWWKGNDRRKTIGWRIRTLDRPLPPTDRHSSMAPLPPRTNPKLPLTEQERKSFRRAKVRLSDVAALSVAELVDRTGLTKSRAEELRGLAEFQTVPSLGPRFAANLIGMGYSSLAQLSTSQGASLRKALRVPDGPLCGRPILACSLCCQDWRLFAPVA